MSNNTLTNKELLEALRELLALKSPAIDILDQCFETINCLLEELRVRVKIGILEPLVVVDQNIEAVNPESETCGGNIGRMVEKIRRSPRSAFEENAINEII